MAVFFQGLEGGTGAFTEICDGETFVGRAGEQGEDDVLARGFFYEFFEDFGGGLGFEDGDAAGLGGVFLTADGFWDQRADDGF